MKVTSIQQQVKRQGRYSVFIDGAYAFSLSERALLESKIVSGQEATEDQVATWKHLSARDDLFAMALRYIAMRARSVWEMREYLKRKGCEPEDATTILNRLSNLGMLDDSDYARRWVANRRLLKPTSRRKLELELAMKHIDSDIIHEVLSEDKAETDERSVLRQLVERKKSHYATPQKLMAYLARQGYSYHDIKAVLDEGDS